MRHFPPSPHGETTSAMTLRGPVRECLLRHREFCPLDGDNGESGLGERPRA